MSNPRTDRLPHEDATRAMNAAAEKVRGKLDDGGMDYMLVYKDHQKLILRGVVGWGFGVHDRDDNPPGERDPIKSFIFFSNSEGNLIRCVNKDVLAEFYPIWEEEDD